MIGMKTTTKKIETVTAAVVAEMSAANGRARIGIRELSIAIEERMGREVDIADIHAAVLRVAAFYGSDNPRCKEAARQHNFGYQAPGGSRLVWVYAL